jgi:hypothetical protein
VAKNFDLDEEKRYKESRKLKKAIRTYLMKMNKYMTWSSIDRVVKQYVENGYQMLQTYSEAILRKADIELYMDEPF